MIAAFFTGLKLALGLILVIGPQNAFVLRQGLRREHVLAVVLFCAASDAILIAAGVAGLSPLTALVPLAQDILRWGGAAFLLVYGLRSFRAAFRGGEVLRAAEGRGAALGPALATVAALTWLNPHVWLDTVVLIGSVAAQFPGDRLAFGAGAASGSFLFFFTLGFGARLLAPLFARPRAWQVLDVAVGVIIWSVAYTLIRG